MAEKEQVNKPTAWMWALLILFIITTAIIAIVTQVQKGQGTTQRLESKARFAGQSPVNQTVANGASAPVSLVYDKFEEVTILPDLVYEIHFPMAGTTGWLNFAGGMNFDIRPTKEHVLLYNGGVSVYESADALSTVPIDANKLRMKVQGIAGNITRISTWRK